MLCEVIEREVKGIANSAGLPAGFPVAGSTTVTAADPAAATSAADTFAVSFEEDTYAVVNGTPFHSTVSTFAKYAVSGPN